MGLPRLQTCCCVLDLKTGNIVLGCLNAFLSFIMMIVMIVVAVSLSTVESKLELVPMDTAMDVEEEAQMTGLYAMTIILVLMFLAKFCFDVFFVYGVIAERAPIIKAYFIMWLVWFILSMFTFFINVTQYSASTVCTELIYIGINVYAILLSHSFYKQLNEREEV